MISKKKILIVDDEPMHLDFFDLMLSKLNFTVEKAKNGQEALEKVKKFMPDLILMDNVMPRMTGFEATRILKNDPKYKDIPIVMISALDDVKDKVEGFELGVEDYITKPFNFYEVLARIRAVLRSRELYAQIVSRESRLSLAEELSTDMKRELQDFIKTINELDETIAILDSEANNPAKSKICSELLKGVSAKSRMVRDHVAELDASIENTISEWERLKKSEIDLPVLESSIRKNFNQG